MPDEFTYDAFLHHSADKPRAQRRAERLKAAGVQMEVGLRLWLDEWVIAKSDLHPSSFHLHPSHARRRFIPLLPGDCALPDALQRCKVVDFREESDAAFAEVPATGQAEKGAMKRRFGLAHGARRASIRRRARQSNATTRPLAPHGMAGFVLANGSMSSNQSGEAPFESAFWMKTSSLSLRTTT